MYTGGFSKSGNSSMKGGGGQMIKSGNSAGSMGGKAREYTGTIKRVTRTSMRNSDKRVDVVLDDGSAASFDVGLKQAGRLYVGKKYAFHLHDGAQRGESTRYSTVEKTYQLKGDPRLLMSEDKFRNMRDARRAENPRTGK